MEEALFRTMLFDSYGELLTEKQREYFDLHYNETSLLPRSRRARAFPGRACGTSSAAPRRRCAGLKRRPGWSRASPPNGTFSPRRRKKLARLETMTEGDAHILTREIAATLQELGHGI